METSILDAIRQSNSELKSNLTTIHQGTVEDRSSNRRAYLDKYILKNHTAIDGVSQAMLEQIDSNKPERMRDSILHSLYFVRIRERQLRINTAHQKTFRWILQQPKGEKQTFSDFVAWLEGSDATKGLYWVAGKPGSGKSTLIRFLSETPDTRIILKTWSKKKPLLYASCFFWLAGTDIQKSLNGLLRSLLYDLLEQAPALLPGVARWRWRAADFGADLPPWTDAELLDAFRALLRNTSQTHCLCLFIDGLDEFDGNFDQQTELVHFLVEASKSESVKICVSSRPYPVFQTAFGEFPHLRLEDLTRDDIKVYVADELGQSPDFVSLRLIYRDRCSDLIQEIVQKAQGVFLWVYLVVRSLRQGLIEGDSMTALVHRLQAIPPDLNEFFMRIIDGIPVHQRHYATIYFELILASPDDLSLLSLFFVEEEDPDFVTKTPLERLPKQIVQARQRAMIRRLDARCRGLLEARKHDVGFGLELQYSVAYLHRTVRDFLLSKDTQRVLNEYLPNTFNAKRFLCKSMLAQLKMSNPAIGDTTEVSKKFLKYATDLELYSSTIDRPLFDEFASILGYKMNCPLEFPGEYIALALFEGLEHTAVDIIETSSVDVDAAYWVPGVRSVHNQCRLLAFSTLGQLEANWDRWELPFTPTGWRPLDLAITALLEQGADPNKSLKDGLTIWEAFLKAAALEHSQGDLLHPAWAGTARAFILHGASRKGADLELPRGRYAKPRDLADVVQEVFKGQGGEAYADFMRESSSKFSRIKAALWSESRDVSASRLPLPAHLEDHKVSEIQKSKYPIRSF